METKQRTKPLILVIDDNPEILDFLVDDLSEAYEVLQALDARSALKLLNEHNVQLIICDIMMPEMDGYEFCRIVKSEISHSHIPIILLTAKNTLQSKIKGLEQGADVYIEKPFSVAHLNAQIQSLIANRNKLRDYFVESPLVHLRTMARSKADKSFLEQLNGTIEEHMTDIHFDVEHLADLMCMSRTTLYRKINAISDLTPNDFINLARLKKAAILLGEGQLKVYEISERVGYSSQTQFGRNFHKQFGITPSQFIGKPLSELRPTNEYDL
ncbi:response regulator transcription factor [Albibacterium profundi]|uniref:Response regulator n=1 Tax=Albibacterium profundi TaxID=3134906 RepID=A0ABV5CB24_9SPHI